MTPVWLEEYQAGVPHTIRGTTYPSCAALFEQSVQRFGSLPALALGEKIITYSELDRLSAQFAAYLQQEVGVAKGDRVAIMLPNIPAYQIALYAIMRIGGVTVSVNPLYSPRELQHQLRDSGASAIIIFDQVLPALEAIIDSTEVRNIAVCSLGDDSAVVSSITGSDRQLSAFSAALEKGSSLQAEPVDISSTDLLFLQYTGGTTGVSKGAALSHGNLLANVEQFECWFAGRLEEGREVFTSALPLYHIFGLMVNGFCAVSIGALSVLMPNPRDLASVVACFRRWDFTFMCGVNTMYNALSNDKDFATLSLKLKYCVAGGASAQRTVAEQWFAKTGCHILEGYGLSETSPILTLNRADITGFTGSIGLPVPSTDISLRDDAGNEVAPGEEGELCAKGPQVMVGYWQRPEATQDAMTEDGYFRTGDIATVDERGYFRIVDRKKDMILVSGFNVFPNEIEEVIASFDGVFEVACVGTPCEKSGEAVKAFIVCKPDVNLEKEAVIEYCRSQLAPYKVPKQIEFLSELPKSNVGKILRRELRDLK